MEVSFIEIYNETIRDLLRDTAKDNEEHEIRHTKDGTEVTNITMIPVDPNDQDQIEEIMRMAARHRSVGHTDMNAQSSRSHSIFTLHLRAENTTHSSRSVLKGRRYT
jgi:kinesin family protein C1